MAKATSELQVVISAKDEASKTLGSLGSKLKFVGIAAAGIAAAGIIKVSKDAIKSAGEIEKVKIAFETFLGSGEKAGALLKDLTDFAAKTPFDLPGVQRAAKQLIAVGAATEDDVIPILKSVGDVSAGVGADLDRIVLNLGQVATQGKLTGREIRDFAVNGIPLIAQLAEQFEVSEAEITDMVSAGTIGFEDVKQAFMDMTGEGGKFEDLMIKQSTTLPGIIENIKDKFGILSRAIAGVDAEGNIAEGGLFDKFKGIAENVLVVIEFLESAFTGSNEAFNEWMQDLDSNTGIITFFKDEIDEIKSLLKDALLPTIIENKDLFIDLAKVIGITLVAALALFVEAVKIIISVTTLAIDLIGKFRQIFVDTTASVISFKDQVLAAFAGIPDTINFQINRIRSFLQNLLTPFQQILDKINEIRNAISSLSSSASNIGSKIGDFLPKFGDGGIVTKPTVALVGEKGPEAIVPLTGPNAGGGAISVSFNNVSVRSDNDLSMIVEAVKATLNRDLVQNNLGV